jgi:hypothetical protein
MRPLPLIALAVAAALASGCEYYGKPNRPIPDGFKAVMLSGKVLDGPEMKGRPWVINLWVPG